MKNSRRNELGVGCLLLLATGLMLWMALQVGAFDFRSKIYVTATFDSAAGLSEGAIVSVAGVQVGTVETLRLTNGRAAVELGLYSGETFSKSTQVRIRSRSVLGEKYVELLDVSAGDDLLMDGDELVVHQEQVEIDQLIGSLGPLIDGADLESLQMLLASLAGAIRENPNLPRDIILNLNELLDKSAAAASGFPNLVEKAEDTLGRLDRTLRKADGLSVKASATLDRIDTLAIALETTADRFPSMAADLEPAINDLKEIASFLRGQTDDVDVILENLREIDEDMIRDILRNEGVRIRFANKKGGSDTGKD